MMLIEETSVPLAALPVDQLKAHLRLGSGFSDDDLQDDILESFLRAAMAAIEARIGKALIEREFSWALTGWRDPGRQVLPISPVTAMLSLTLTDGNGDATLVASADYRLEPDLQQPRLIGQGGHLPRIPHDGSVELRFIAGYAAEWSDSPADLQQAVMLLAAHYYEYRHETALQGGCMPFGVTSLIERYRPLRTYFGGGQ